MPGNVVRRDAPFAGFSLAAIPVVTNTLLDNARVGTMVACMSRATNITANTDQSFTHALGRKPNGYLVLRSAKGGVLYDGTNLGSDWTPSTIVLRSTVASDTVSFLLW